MVKATALLLALSALLPSGRAGEWAVCVRDEAALLTAPSRAAILQEFQKLMAGERAKLIFGACPERPLRIDLSISAAAPEHLPGVLGRARRGRDGIEPRLEVFYYPLIRYLGDPNSFTAIGRALARVAAHEAGHFLAQQGHHCSHGLLRHGYSAYELSAPDSHPFRNTGRCRPAGSEAAEDGLRADASKLFEQPRDSHGPDSDSSGPPIR